MYQGTEVALTHLHSAIILRIRTHNIFFEKFPYRRRLLSPSNVTCICSITGRNINELFMRRNAFEIRVCTANIVSVMHVMLVTWRTVGGYPGKMY